MQASFASRLGRREPLLAMLGMTTDEALYQAKEEAGKGQFMAADGLG